jgi:hypothetical protein
MTHDAFGPPRSIAFGPAPSISFGPPPTIAFPVLDAAGRIELAAVLDVRSGMLQIAAVLRHRADQEAQDEPAITAGLPPALPSPPVVLPPALRPPPTVLPPALPVATPVVLPAALPPSRHVSAQRHAIEIVGQPSRRGSRSLRGGSGRRA